MESQSGKVIGFDMDGVIIDHTALRVKLAKDFGFTLRPEDTPSDVLRKLLPEDKRRAIQNAIYNIPETALRAGLMPGADEGLEKLTDAGLAFYLISRRKDPEIAIQLLSLHGLWPKYFNDKNSYFVEGAKEKDIEARRIGITHYTDDEAEVLTALQSVKNKILFDQYKKHLAENFVLASSWSELTKLLLE